jgi:hypothetical protein
VIDTALTNSAFGMAIGDPLNVRTESGPCGAQYKPLVSMLDAIRNSCANPKALGTLSSVGDCATVDAVRTWFTYMSQGVGIEPRPR